MHQPDGREKGAVVTKQNRPHPPVEIRPFLDALADLLADSILSDPKEDTLHQENTDEARTQPLEAKVVVLKKTSIAT